MKYEDLQKDFSRQITDALKEFAVTEQNKEVYAIAFDCDTENGQICLRYSNSENFEAMKEKWEDYKDMYQPYGQNGLFGLKYSRGEYVMLKFQYTGITGHFLDSYYYCGVGEYCGEGEPISSMEIDGEVLGARI